MKKIVFTAAILVWIISIVGVSLLIYTQDVHSVTVKECFIQSVLAPPIYNIIEMENRVRNPHVQIGMATETIQCYEWELETK